MLFKTGMIVAAFAAVVLFALALLTMASRTADAIGYVNLGILCVLVGGMIAVLNRLEKPARQPVN